MADIGTASDGNANALRDMNNIMAIEHRSSPSSSNLEPLDFQTSWSSKLAKYDLLSVITDIDDDIDSLTLTDTEDDGSDVAMIPEARVTFATPLVSAVHTIPRLTSEQIRILYYSRAERYFFKKQYRLERKVLEMARQDDPASAYQTLMGMNSNRLK